MAFFDELKRRNVIRVAVLYLVASWGVLQVAALIFGVLGVPNSSMRLLLILLVLGFPVAIGVSWFYAVTPSGLQREEELARSPAEASAAGRRMNLLIAVLLAAAIGVVLVDRYLIRPEAKLAEVAAAAAAAAGSGAASAAAVRLVAAPPASIAVLPFANLSDDPSNEYFSDGLTEEILNVLARVPELKVIARTSSFSYKGKQARIEDIARELNVAHVLEGSVRKAGDQLRITAKLVRGADSSQVWSETYDRTTDDSFGIQDEISRRVVDALRPRLLAGVSAALEAGGTQVGAAYEAFLRGQFERNRGNAPEILAAAVAAFDRAIELDPAFAKARAARAFTVANQAMNAYIPFEAGFADASAEAQRAIELAPDIPDGHRVLARIKLYGEHDLDAARDLLTQAQRAGGDDATTLRLVMDVALREGRYNDAIEAARRFTLWDPVPPRAPTTLGVVLWYDRRFDEAQTAADRGLALAPDRPGAHYVTAVIALSRGNAARAVADCEQESIDWQKKSCLAIAYRRVGRPDDAKRELAELQAESGDGFAYQYAQIHAQWGETANAFRWLEVAEKVKDPGLILANGDPLLDPIRQDARFARLVERLGLAG
jgi:adenylate cyclase